jgi:hypothetical protein
MSTIDAAKALSRDLLAEVERLKNAIDPPPRRVTPASASKRKARGC